MKLSFTGFENTLDILPGRISVLQIESIHLFSRVCQSLLEQGRQEPLEPFSLWSDDGKELSKLNSFLSVANLFNLPWQNRALLTSLYERIDRLIKEDDLLRQKIESSHQEFEHLIIDASLRLNGSYLFGTDWSVSQSLKAYSFIINRSDSSTLFDNLIRFIEFVHDVALEKILIFVNLEKFLTKNELIEFETQLFFHNIPALVLVQGNKKLPLKNSKNLFIDQEFLEVLS